MNIIITGASKGIGLSIARQFAKDSNNLFICSRHPEELKLAENQLQCYSIQSKILSMQTDLSKRNDINAFADFCLRHGTPDIIINNAGRFLPGSIYNEDESCLEKMMQINLYSAYHFTRKLLPSMMEKKQGHVFNICSIASLKAYSNGGSYSISKFALLGFSKNLREEMKAFNIKVTAVMPGAAYTSSWAGSGIDENRIMEADDVAKMVYAAAHLSPQACVEDIILRPQLGDL